MKKTKNIKNLFLKNHQAPKVPIYMESFWHTAESSLLKSKKGIQSEHLAFIRSKGRGVPNDAELNECSYDYNNDVILLFSKYSQLD
jgi:hypothetical protein